MITLGNKKVYAELEIVQLFLATIGDLCTLSRFSQESSFISFYSYSLYRLFLYAKRMIQHSISKHMNIDSR